MSRPTESDHTPDHATSLETLLTLLETLPPSPETNQDAEMDEHTLFAALLEAMPAEDIAAFLDLLPQVSLTDNQQQQLVRLATVTRAMEQHAATKQAFFAPGGAALATLRTFTGHTIEDVAARLLIEAGALKEIEAGIRAWYAVPARGVRWIAHEAGFPVRLVQTLLESAQALELRARFKSMPSPAASLLRDAGHVSERRFDENAVLAGLREPYETFFRELTREAE